MRRRNSWLGVVLLATLAACHAKEYRFSPAQSAWQGYQAGQVLRFGHDQDARVRTFQVVDLQDHMEGEPVISIGPAPLYQEIQVKVQRIDSIYPVYKVLDFALQSTHGGIEPVELNADVEWESFYDLWLPIDSVSRNAPIDTLRYRNIKLLANSTLGPTTYAQVLCYSRVDTTRLGIPYSKRLYYARNYGVVAYEEDGKGLWYRLP